MLYCCKNFVGYQHNYIMVAVLAFHHTKEVGSSITTVPVYIYIIVINNNRGLAVSRNSFIIRRLYNYTPSIVFRRLLSYHIRMHCRWWQHLEIGENEKLLGSRSPCRHDGWLVRGDKVDSNPRANRRGGHEVQIETEIRLCHTLYILRCLMKRSRPRYWKVSVT